MSSCNFTIGNVVYYVVYPEAVTLYGGFRLKTAVARVRAVKVTLYVHENLTFKLTKNRRVNIQKT